MPTWRIRKLHVFHDRQPAPQFRRRGETHARNMVRVELHRHALLTAIQHGLGIVERTDQVIRHIDLIQRLDQHPDPVGLQRISRQ